MVYPPGRSIAFQPCRQVRSSSKHTEGSASGTRFRGHLCVHFRGGLAGASRTATPSGYIARLGIAKARSFPYRHPGSPSSKKYYAARQRYSSPWMRSATIVMCWPSSRCLASVRTRLIW